MAAATTSNLSYDDFEPYCKWHRGQHHDTLEVHLQGFKKEQLKVQLNKHGIVTISGERPSGEHKVISRFRFGIRVSKDCKTDEIRAKLSGGILSVVMPKKTSSPASTTRMPLSPPNDQEPPTRPRTNVDNIVKDTMTTKPTNNTISRLNGIVLELKMSKRMPKIVAVAVALLIALGAFLIYRYRQPSPVDCSTFDGSCPN